MNDCACLTIRYIIKKRQGGFFDLVRQFHDAWSGWLCVLFVGVVAGGVAGVIDIGARSVLAAGPHTTIQRCGGVVVHRVGNITYGASGVS